MLSLPVSLSKQEVIAFYCRLLSDPCRFHRMGVFRDAEHNDDVQNSDTLIAHQTGSGSISLIDLCRFHRKGVSRDAEYNGEAQNVVTSCFACQTGSDSFSCHLLIDPCRFHRKGVSRDAEHNGEVQNFGTLFRSPNRK